MDNVTHTIAGLLLTETAVRARRASVAPRLHLIAAISAAIGANLPDADLVYTSLRGERLGYLLHHRGHSHTIVVALVGGLALWAIALTLWRRRSTTSGRAPRDGRWLLTLLVVAVMSHLALDFTNNYGVHPFWPVSARWFYGDAVFIVEPWLWVAAVPPLIFASTRSATRVGLGLVLAAGLVLAWTMAMVPQGVAIALTIGTVLSALLAWQCAPRVRPLAGVVGWLLATTVFVVATRAARAEVLADALAVEQDPSPRVVDIVITPAVSNPFCATAIAVQTSGAFYRVRTARVAPFASLVSLADCGATGARRASVRWEDTWEAPLAELRALAASNCVAAAMLEFVRVPVWSFPDSASVELHDWRYSGRLGGGFAALRFARRPS